jgi:glycosyltransferase involved in cell wall biosynthesis
LNASRNLRVLHVITSGQRRGGDVFASDLSAALTELGVDQRVVALRPSDPLSMPFAIPFRALRPSGRRLPAVRMDLGSVQSLRGTLRQWRPDVVQAHGGEPYKYSLAASPFQRPPVVYRRIGGAPPWLMHGPRRLAHAQLMRQATTIVAVAECIRRESLELFSLNPTKIRTIPNAVAIDRITPVRGRMNMRAELDLDESAVVILSLGSLSWEKDPLTQLDVAERVLRERPEAVHLFVGDGPMRPEIERSILSRELEQRCQVLGSRADVGDILAASDVLLFASRADGMEGMPATIIEAGIAALPVVGYSIAGVPEVVDHGVTGLLAAHGDVGLLASHLLALVAEPVERHAMGNAARERCRSSFDIRAIAPQYLEVYEQVGDG